MKKVILGGACAFALLAAAGVANAQSTGYVGASYTDFEDAQVYALRGVTSFQLAESYELQLDGDYANVDIDDIPDVTVWGPTVHLFREGESYKAGLFAAYQDADEADLWGYGLEGRFFAGDALTLGGSAAIGNMDVLGVDVDLTSWRGEGSYFFSDNFRLDMSWQTTNIDIVGGDADFDTIAFGGEYQFGNSPFSITFLAEDVSSDDLGDGNAYTLGGRWVFGGSLKDRDRNSAPFHGVSTSLGGSFQTVLTGIFGLVE